jgi:hypothetical protein
MALFQLLSWTGNHPSSGYYTLVGLPGLAAWILMIVGASFCIPGPTRFGARGLAIATVVVCAVYLVLMLVDAQKADRDLAAFGPAVSRSSFDWKAPVESTPYLTHFLAILTTKADSLNALKFIAGLLEVAAYVLFALFLGAVCKAARAHSTAKGATGIMITIPSVVVGLMVLWLILSIVFKNSGPSAPRSIDVRSAEEARRLYEETRRSAESAMSTIKHLTNLGLILTYGALCGIMVWFALTALQARDAVMYGRRR